MKGGGCWGSWVGLFVGVDVGLGFGELGVGDVQPQRSHVHYD